MILTQLGTSVIPLFIVILTGYFISGIISIIQDHLQGQKINCKVKRGKKNVFEQIRLGTSVIPLYDVILTAVFVFYILKIKNHLKGQNLKINFKGQD